MNKFYPSKVLVTAADIIFLWVARMIMAGIHFKQELPFKDLYFSAIVTDKKGRKFSKTLGNGIDPLEVIDKYGADAVRFTAVSLAPLGGRIMMEVGDFEQGSRFANKIWNAAKFLNNHLGSTTELRSLSDFPHSIQTQWLLRELDTSSQEINRLLENYRLNDAVQEAHRFMWTIFCDWGLEIAKEELVIPENRDACLSVLVYVFNQALRLLHPVMPFITEHLWQNLIPHPDLDRPKSICLARFPEVSTPRYQDSADFQSIIDLIVSIRSSRQQVGLPSNTALDAQVLCEEKVWKRLAQGSRWIKKLAQVNTLVRVDNRQKNSIVGVHRDFEVFLPAHGLIDFAKEKQRLHSEELRLSKILQQLEAKLNNPGFIKNADPAVVEQSHSQKENISQQLLSLRKNQESLA
jgi:valyl-tRNA synthetase